MTDYNSFGAEWELEMLLFKKQDLVEMLRAALKNRFTTDKLIKEQVEELKKESYKEGIRDAINICDEAIENDFSSALRNRTWIRNKLQQLKEQK